MKKNWVIGIVLTVIVGYNFFEAFFSEKSRCPDKVEILMEVTRQLEEEKRLLELNLQKLNREADSLMVLVKKENEIVIYLTERKNEKVRAVDRLTHHELADFFARIKTDSSVSGIE